MHIYSSSGDTSEYLPYTYLIRWTKLGIQYYGCKYGQDAHPSRFWIDYQTSSTYVAEFVERNGEPDFMQIRRTFAGLSPIEGSKQALAWEHRVLTALDAKNNPAWLNQSNGGDDWGFISGMVVVKDKDGNYLRVAQDDPRYLKGELVGTTRGQFAARDSEGNIVHISVDDPRRLDGTLAGVAKGTVSVKDSAGHKFKVALDDPRYLEGELVGVTKGTVTVVDSQGNNLRVSMDDPRYLEGDLVAVQKGFTIVKDKDGKRKRVPIDEFKSNDEYRGVCKDTASVFDENGKVIRVSINHPKYVSGEYQHINNGRIKVANANGDVKRLHPKDARVVSGEFWKISKR